MNELYNVTWNVFKRTVVFDYMLVCFRKEWYLLENDTFYDGQVNELYSVTWNFFLENCCFYYQLVYFKKELLLLLENLTHMMDAIYVFEFFGCSIYVFE